MKELINWTAHPNHQNDKSQRSSEVTTSGVRPQIHESLLYLLYRLNEISSAQRLKLNLASYICIIISILAMPKRIANLDATSNVLPRRGNLNKIFLQCQICMPLWTLE